jgi:hypothetical protein
MAFEEALIQGVTQGGISGVTLYIVFKYVLPRADAFQGSLDRIETKIDMYVPIGKRGQKK